MYSKKIANHHNDKKYAIEQNNSIRLLNVGILSFLVVLIISIQACTDQIQLGNDFLKKPPSVGVTKDSIFSSAERADQFLAHAYSSLPYGPMTFIQPHNYQNLFTDMLASLTDINQTYMPWGGVIDVYYNNSGFPWNIRKDKYNYEAREWPGIRSAYIFIDNVDKVPDMSATKKKQRKAEARMIIAIQYTQLFRNYGGLPWVDHAYKPTERFKLGRLTAKATLDSTVALIDKAIPNLPFSLNNPEQISGRFTQAGAMGLKCRLLLFGASPLFNNNQPYMAGEAANKKLVWYGGYDPSLWKRATDACGALIKKVDQTGTYHLKNTGNPRQDFQDAYFSRTSPEVLISTRRQYQTATHPFGGYYYGELFGGGAGPTTDTYVKMFPMANGKPITDPNSGYDRLHPYKNRDPRLYETVLVNGDKLQGRKAEMWIGGRDRPSKNEKTTATGYIMRKWAPEEQQSEGTPGAQWCYLRLPEIYLSYAEALNEENGGPTPEAYKYVNKVRNRVDLGDLPTGITQKQFRNVILRERALELGYENVRWYDMVRWKLKGIFTKTLYGMDICKKNSARSPENVCKKPGSYQSGEYIYHQFKLPSRHWQNHFSPKWYLSPFPLDEIRKGYLVQNPGWKL